MVGLNGIFVLSVLLNFLVVGVHAVAFHNSRPGDSNALKDAHDGPIVQWQPGGPFYRYAMAYTKCELSGSPMKTARWALNRFIELMTPTGFDCAPIVTETLSEGWGNDCGFQTPAAGQTVATYKSTTLQSWIYVGDALENAPAWLREDSILFRPAILRSPTTGQYVLWINHLPKNGVDSMRIDEKTGMAKNVVESYKVAGFVVGTSTTPEGPFTFAEKMADARPSMEFAGGADFSLLHDDDTGDAFIAYGSWHNFRISEGWRARWYPDWLRDGHQIAIQKLDPSFTRPDIAISAVTVTTEGQEAPSFFKRNGFFYLVHGDLCCFCRRGSDAKVLVATSAFGPYTQVGQLNAFGAGHVPAQSSDVFEVRDANGDIQYIWSADLWFSAQSGLKGDDHQYWHPLEFVDKSIPIFHTTVPVPQLRGSRWQDCFELDLSHLPGGIDVEACPTNKDQTHVIQNSVGEL